MTLSSVDLQAVLRHTLNIVHAMAADLELVYNVAELSPSCAPVDLLDFKHCISIV